MACSSYYFKVALVGFPPDQCSFTAQNGKLVFCACPGSDTGRFFIKTTARCAAISIKTFLSKYSVFYAFSLFEYTTLFTKPLREDIYMPGSCRKCVKNRVASDKSDVSYY